MNLITETSILTEMAPVNIVEFESSTIKRRVKSTMAAESAALGVALDRHLFVRLLLESIIYGEPDYNSSWREKLKIPGIMVTDAASLYDHLHKTGSVPQERQILSFVMTLRFQIAFTGPNSFKNDFNMILILFFS